MIHGVGFVMFGKITRVGRAETVMRGERFEKIQTRIAEGMLPKNRKPILLNLPVVDQGAMKVGQRPALRQHGRKEHFLFTQAEGFARAHQDLNMPRRAGMAELVENFLSVDLGGGRIIKEKTEMLVKGRGVNRIDHWHKGNP